jgi:molecular chaperone Hsp33
MVGQAASQKVLNLPVDDCVVVFRTESSGVYGRLVRLGPVAQSILKPHALPAVAAAPLGEAVVLAALLGSALTDRGNIAVQTKTNGIVSMLYADCEAPGQLRGYARYDAGTLAALTANGDTPGPGSIIGTGHLAFTIDTGGDGERYQGVIALDGGTLAQGTSEYFEQREALPTFVRLAVAQHYAGARNGLPAEMQWRCGGIMIQDPRPENDADDSSDEGDEPWQRARMLTATIEDHELLDPALTAERLLLRLFHKEGVIIERVLPLTAYCKCSRDKIANLLKTFGADDILDMRDDAGKITVTCEFCAAAYPFYAADVAALQSK